MLQLYRNEKGRLDVISMSQPSKSPIIWVDLIAPTPAERAYVIKHFNQPLFSISELEEIESSARFYEDENGLHILSFFLCEIKSDQVRVTTIGFVLQEDRLFSLREKEISTFRIYITRYKRQNLLKTGGAYEQLLNILETKTEQLADEIEFIYSELDALNQLLTSQTNTSEDEFYVTLLTLARLEDSSSKIRLCLMDSQRAIVYLTQKFRARNVDLELLEMLQGMHKNVDSLIPHNEALFQRINFMSQTAMGLIGINQNRIMKVMSVFAVISMPTTLITGWLGMDIKAFFGDEYLKAVWQLPAIFIMVVSSGLFFYLAKRVFRWI